MEFNGIFKNLYPFRFSEPCTLDPYTLSGELAKAAFRPCGSQDIVTCGWVPPIGGEGWDLVHVSVGYWLICLQDDALEIIEDTKADTLAEEIDARFVLMTLELAAFLPEMVEAFGGELSMTAQGEA